MNVLDNIILNKRKEVEERKSIFSLQTLLASSFYDRECISVTNCLNDINASGIIAEHKRKSPSKGIINDRLSVLEVVKSYQDCGASAVSILTDEIFFGGTNQDLVSAREILSIPILRKEFIIDEYQIHEAKSLGADFILLIAACLRPEEVKRMARLANSIGLEVLLELHDEEELGHMCDEIQLVGINNRSLKTFEVNIDRSLRMAEQLPSDKIKVAESGIDNSSQVLLFKENGYRGFLIGENFMKTEDPGKALGLFMKEINKK